MGNKMDSGEMTSNKWSRNLRKGFYNGDHEIFEAVQIQTLGFLQ